MTQAAIAGRMRRRVAGRSRPHLLGELAVVAALLIFYDRVRAHASLRHVAALAHGQDVLNLERHLRLDWERRANRWLNGHTTLRAIDCWYYQLAHITVAMAVLSWCYVAAPRVYRPARNTLVATNVTGLLVFALYPVAPPRLLPGNSFIDSVAVALGDGTVAHPAPDQYAAMPSLHLAWATWSAMTVWAVTGDLGRWHWLRIPAVAHPMLTAAAVVSTANHYVLDVVAGVGLSVIAWLGVARLTETARSTGRPLPAVGVR
jgi:PAP2 superfamily